jgi:hypothetical protein
MKRFFTMLREGLKRVKDRLVREIAPFATLALVTGPAFAQMSGTDTSTSSLTSAQSWMMTWIPIACTLGLIVSALAWMFHMLRLDWAVRLCVGMICIGSASYIVGWFGL